MKPLENILFSSGLFYEKSGNGKARDCRFYGFICFFRCLLANESGLWYYFVEVISMKYFVIHSGADYTTVEKLITEWSAEFDNAQFIILEGTQDNWEGDAIARIRECGKVLYLVGENSARSENIHKELVFALRENKEIYIYKLSKDNAINEILLKNKKSHQKTEGEYEGEIVIGKAREKILELNREQLLRKLHQDSIEIEKILKGKDFSDKETLMQQYQMFVQTSEELVRRKQSVNSFYVTLNSLMLSAIVSILCAVGDIMSLTNGDVAIYIISAFLSVIGTVICCSWITLLNSYSDLNASKMAIIGCIEERLAVKLYDTEWALLTRIIGNRKYRSFTLKELAVAKIFVVLYGIVFIVCAILLGMER